MNTHITNQQRNELLKFQQGELDAVIIYQKLAGAVKNPDHKETFRKIAADEGKHAAILRKYSGEHLTPKKIKAFIILMLYKIIGFNQLLGLLIKGEEQAAVKYASYLALFPLIHEIISDEDNHAKLMSKMK